MVSVNGSIKLDVASHINSVECAFATLFKIWEFSYLKTRIKSRLFCSNNLSVTTVVTEKLQAFMNPYLRLVTRYAGLILFRTKNMAGTQVSYPWTMSDQKAEVAMERSYIMQGQSSKMTGKQFAPRTLDTKEETVYDAA